jgi:major membrane immunogen (membrane-anchored lipoprotein)
MKLVNFYLAIILCVFTFKNASAQDASINLTLQNSGIVSIGSQIYLQVDITNNDATNGIVQNKLRPQISVPIIIGSFSLTASDHLLSSGWTITSNTGSVIRITNTTDPIPAGVTRTSLIAVNGTAAGNGIILGNLTFVGAAPLGDNSANNSSTAGLTVTTLTPLTVTDFNVKLINCQPVLKWTTQNEINSARFEVERDNLDNSGWKAVGTIIAKGNTATKSEYSLTDKDVNASSEKVLYRLKIIDKDGRYKYSDLLPVLVNCKTVQAQVYPNPVKNGKLYVSLTGTSGNSDAILLSISGQVILRSKLSNGTNYLNVSGVANGSYVLSIQDANAVNQKVKVLIQK